MSASGKMASNNNAATSDAQVPDGLPPLRFRDGNVVVKLSSDPSKNLLLHTDVLKTAMPLLAPALESRWDQGDAVINPISGKAMEVYTVALRYTDKTLLLEGKEFVELKGKEDLDSSDLCFIHKSDLGTDGWPDDEGYIASFDHLLENISTLYHALFALLYGHPLTLAALKPDGYFYDSDHRQSINPALPEIAALCALAEYHGALPVIAPAVIELVSSHHSFWKDVACSAVSWMRLAAKLRWEDLYFDAARHFIAGGDFEAIASEFDMSRQDAETKFKPLLEISGHKIQSLRNALLRLGLTQQRFMFSDQPITAYTSLLHALGFRQNNRNAVTQACERFDYLATSIFSEWMVKHVAVGDRLYINAQGKVRATDLPGLGHVFAKLSDAGKWDCPANVFGRYTPERYVNMFKLERRFSPADRIRTTLNELVTTAAELIDHTFDAHEVDVGDEKLTARRSHYDGHEDRFTYLPLDEKKLSWEKEPAWNVTPLPEVDLACAGEAVLEALGLANSDKEDVSGKEEVGVEVDYGIWTAWDEAKLGTRVRASGKDDEEKEG